LLEDGPHVLRHGGMSHLEHLLTGEEGVNMVDSAIMQVLQVSKNTFSRYTKSNLERLTQRHG
jgi:hypothetical protein